MWKSPDDEERPRAWKRKPPPKLDVRSPQASLFDFPLRQAAEAKRDAEFVDIVIKTPTSELQGMVRGEGSIESQRAAVDQLSGRAKLQARIVAIIETEGPQTDRELEERPEFAHYGPSSVRKRRSENLQAGRLVKIGRRDGMAVWDVAR